MFHVEICLPTAKNCVFSSYVEHREQNYKNFGNRHVGHSTNCILILEPTLAKRCMTKTANMACVLKIKEERGGQHTAINL